MRNQRPRQIDHLRCLRHTHCQRLLTEHVTTAVQRRQRQRVMGGRWCGDDDDVVGLRRFGQQVATFTKVRAVGCCCTKLASAAGSGLATASFRSPRANSGGGGVMNGNHPCAEQVESHRCQSLRPHRRVPVRLARRAPLLRVGASVTKKSVCPVVPGADTPQPSPGNSRVR